MDIKTLVEENHNQAVKSGFYEKPISFMDKETITTKLMLIVSELSEALEALRKDFSQVAGLDWCKDTFEDEIADATIRIFDLCGALGIDLEWQLENKMKYNSHRAVKHGKAF